MILCWLHRTVASFSLDSPRRSSRAARRGTPDLPVFVQRHLDACPECRHALDAERAVNERLITGAGHARLPAPPFLEARILANLGAAAASGREEFRGRVFPIPRGVFAAGLALVAGALLMVLSRTPASRPTEATAPPGLSALPAFEFASLGFAATRDLTGLSATFEKPLEGEFRLAVNDVQHAAVSLAESLLPDSAAQAFLRRPEP